MTGGSVSLATLADWLARFDAILAEREASGATIASGMAAVMEKVGRDPAGTVDEVFKLVGMTLAGSAGSADGPLYGTFFLRFGMTCGATSSLEAGALGRALRAGLEGVAARGSVRGADTSMVDNIAPAIEAYDAAVAAGADIAAATRAAAGAVGGIDSRSPSSLLFAALALAMAEVS